MVSRDRTRPFQQPDIAVIEDCAVGGAMVLVPRNAHIQANVHRGVLRPSPWAKAPTTSDARSDAKDGRWVGVRARRIIAACG